MRSRRWLSVLLTALLIFGTVASDFMVVSAEDTIVEEATETVETSEAQEVSVEVVESEETVADDPETILEEVSEASVDSEESSSEELSEDNEVEDSAEVVEVEGEEAGEGVETEIVDAEIAETEIADAEASVETEIGEENMPACDFGTFDVAGMSVAISAPEGAFPEGTTVEVKEVSFPVEKIEGQLEDGKEIVEMKAVDITFYFEGEEIQPKNEISVVFANANLAGEEVSVFHEKNDSVEEVDTISASADGAEIWADSFSVYVVVSASGVMLGDAPATRLNLKFDENGGSTGVPDATGISAGDVVVLPDYTGTKDGFVFVGWSTDRNANNGGKYTTPVYPADSKYTMGDSDVTLYAIWAKESVETEFFIRLDGKIPYEPQPHSTSQYTAGIFIDNAIRVAKFTSCNVGRGVEDNLNIWPTTEQIQEVHSSYDPETQYVLWYVIKHETDGWHVDGVLLDRDKVNLTYNANVPVGAGAFDNLPLGKQVVQGATTKIAENIPTRNDGYWFSSWNTKPDGTGTSYSPNEQIKMDSDVTLYAQWEKKTKIKITACNLSKTFDGEEIDTNDRGDDIPVWSVNYELPKNHELTVYTEVDGSFNNVSQTKDGGGDGKHVVKSVNIVDTITKEKVTDRYDITKVAGNVKILPVEIPVTVTCKERVYNGKPIDTEVSFDESLLVEGDRLEVTVTNPITDVQVNGREVISVKTETKNTWSRSDDDALPVDSKNYIVTVTQADMKIMPAPLKVTTYSASKVYDSSPLTAAGSISGLVGEETVTFAIEGSQTEVGNSPNSYKLEWNKTAKETNYTVQETVGTLEVKPVEPTTPPTGPTPEPPTGPTPEPTPTPAPVPVSADTMVVNIADEATPLAAAGDVLGARRGVEADGGSVLGARRVKAVLGARRGAQTADENAMAMYMAMMGVSASFAGLYTIARRKKRSAKNQ